MQNPSYLYLLLFTLFVFTACNKDPVGDGMGTGNETPPNILLIIADDMGKDATSGFSEGSIKPNTPHINEIKNQGISFNNFWVYPTCSPTRSSIITGKYGLRTNVISVGDKLQSDEIVLQKYINQESSTSYATAIVGKWHLGAGNNSPLPESFGIDHYSGIISGAIGDYYDWDYYEDGQLTNETTYSTEKLTDVAIDWVNTQSKPWFLWLAYNAPHTPFHAPPEEMHSQGNLTPYENGDDALPYFMAAIEAMDYQIGKLLDNLDPAEKDNTVIIFIGDNGSPGQVAQTPFRNNTSKGSLYQGGINTPLFVSGKNIDRIGAEDQNLINSTDLYATIASLTGAEVSQINDSQRFNKLFTQSEEGERKYQYAERNQNGEAQWTISNGAYKIIANDTGTIEMYDLSQDPYEMTDLLTGTLSTIENEAKIDLETESQSIRN